MRVEFDISDDKVQYFSEDAKSELKKQSEKIIDEIVNEAGRIEASRRLPDSSSEVTQSNVKEAATLRNILFEKKPSIWNKLIQAIAFISTLIAGCLLDLSAFTDLSHVVWFIVILFIAVVANVYLIFK